jgi:hypothetical protein
MTTSNLHVNEKEACCSILLNNRAVARLQAGREDEAMELLEKGLSLLRDQFLNSPQEPRRSTLETMTTNSSTAEMQNASLDTQRTTIESTCCSDQGDSKIPSDLSLAMSNCMVDGELGRSCCIQHSRQVPTTTITFSSVPLPFRHSHSHVLGVVDMYERALVIHHPEMADGDVGGHRTHLLLHPQPLFSPTSSVSSSTYEILSAVILYNMGLMHHRRGMIMSTSSSAGAGAGTDSIRMIRYLDDAFELYRIGLYVLEQSPITTNATTPSTSTSLSSMSSDPSLQVDLPISSLSVVLLRLAMLNNLLQIASLRSRIETFKYALVDMYHVLNRVVTIHQEQQEERMDESEFALFYSNWEQCCSSLVIEDEEEDDIVETMTLAPAA